MGSRLGDVGRQLAALLDPLHPAAVEQAHVGVAEQLEHPEGVRRPPVEVVAVEHDGGVAADPVARAQVGEPLAVDVVAGHRVVEVEVPVDLDGAGDVPGVVEQHVLVGLDHHEAGVVQVLGQPLGGDEQLGVGVLGSSGESSGATVGIGVLLGRR